MQTLRFRKGTCTDGKPSRARLPVFSLFTIPPEPTVKVAEAARLAWVETQAVRRRSNEISP